MTRQVAIESPVINSPSDQPQRHLCFDDEGTSDADRSFPRRLVLDVPGQIDAKTIDGKGAEAGT